MSSTKVDPETKQNKENKPKRRRRTKSVKSPSIPKQTVMPSTGWHRPQAENQNKRRPIRVVSSLGEGKLLDRFQNAIMEKETKKKSRERGERDRKNTKEKREREMAKFKAELDALLEDESPNLTKPKDKKVFVPKLSGTVKGKFEALEQKKKEEEENKISNERQRRVNRDLIEKKRIQIEIAQKKQQGPIANEKDEPVNDMKLTSNFKKPGKLKHNFEDKDRQRKEKEKKKIEMEKKMKLSAELRAVKEYYFTHKETDDMPEENKFAKTENVPQKLKTKFDDLLREKEEKDRKEAKKLKRKQLEEETQQMRAAKLASQYSSSQDTNEGSSSSLTGSTEALQKNPKRLSSSFTKFDVLERERVEAERKRIRERRKTLLEEETKLFEQSKLLLEQVELNKDKMTTQSEILEVSSSEEYTESGSDETETTEKRRKQKKKRKKLLRTPSKLATSKLKFDVLERERLESERVRIQTQRQALLEEEKKLFEEARKKQETDSSENEFNFEEVKRTSAPGRLNDELTKFDFLTSRRMDEERKRIKHERNRLFEEEKRLMEEEKKKIQEIEERDKNVSDAKIASKHISKIPKRLDKSFTEFDILERQRVKNEEERMYKEKAKKLEEEKKLFEEARNNMSSADEEDEKSPSKLDSSRKPSKLPLQLTKFDVLEKERMEEARQQSQKEKNERLEEELKMFQEQKKSLNQDSDDDITSNARELIKLSKKGPRPKRLSDSLTQFDLMERKRREEERVLLQKKKAEQLAHEREIFEQCRQQDEQVEDVLDSKQIQSEVSARPVKKMNVREKMEAVLKAQEEAERKRIDETKFTRMTVEQQEIFLAKQKQIEFLKEQLAKAELGSSSEEDSYEDSDEEYSDDDDDDENYYYRYSEDNDDKEDEYSGSSNGRDEEEEDTSMCSASTSSSGSYSGVPYFVQTLKNVTVKEGDPVRFDANINANPHPKVTWYFRNRLIRNSPDYQYMSKGTQYSLYMNESFLDDVGEYMCKANNEKGAATSKAYLIVKDAE